MLQLFPIVRRSGAVPYVTAVSLGVIFVAGSGSGLAQGYPRHPHKEHKRDEKREIEAIEEQWRAAQLSGDVGTMDKLLAEDYFGISITGQLNDKAQQLDRLQSRKFVLSKIDVSDVRIKLLGRVAIVTSLAKIEGADSGESVQGTFRYTRVYKRYPDGSWKITNFEVTRVPKPE